MYDSLLACVGAMERGLLNVYAIDKQGYYFWARNLTFDTWQKVFAVRPCPVLFWSSASSLRFCDITAESHLIISQEYLWQDLSICGEVP
jgi:hypothetical protein